MSNEQIDDKYKCFEIPVKPQGNLIKFKGTFGIIWCRIRPVKWSYAMRIDRTYIVGYYGDQYYAIKPVRYRVAKDFVGIEKHNINEFINRLVH